MFPSNHKFGKISIVSNWFPRITLRLNVLTPVKMVSMSQHLKTMDLLDYVLVIKNKWMIGFKLLFYLKIVNLNCLEKHKAMIVKKIVELEVPEWKDRDKMEEITEMPIELPKLDMIPVSLLELS